MTNNFISEGLGKQLQNMIPKRLAKIIQPLFFKILAIGEMDRIHSGARDLKINEHFAERVFHKDVMNIKLDVSVSDLMKIPKKGPLVVVANHPYGGIDGIALLAILKRVRPDVKIMANYILGGIPELRNDFFLVDPFGKNDSVRKSYAGIKEAVKWIKEGHILGIFPAGEVSAYNKEMRKVIDKNWSKTTGTIIRSGKCSVQCVYFYGHNSKFFNFLGRINPVLRTLWLPREFHRQENSILKIKIGKVIHKEQIALYKETSSLTDYLRGQTYLLEKQDCFNF